MFLSKTKRNGNYSHDIKQVKQNPGKNRVCYDDKANTIGEIMRKKKDQISNPLLASLVTKNSTTMAFSSNAPRFADKIVGEETYIGPGYYEQPSCFEKGSRSTLGSKVKSGNNNSMVNLGSNTRSAQYIATNIQANKIGGVSTGGGAMGDRSKSPIKERQLP